MSSNNSDIATSPRPDAVPETTAHFQVPTAPLFEFADVASTIEVTNDASEIVSKTDTSQMGPTMRLLFQLKDYFTETGNVSDIVLVNRKLREFLIIH